MKHIFILLTALLLVPVAALNAADFCDRWRCCLGDVTGAPVRFFVVVGPAVVQGDKLVLTKIPPRTKFPVSVTVAAWQWGRGTEPKVRTAEIVKQTFKILAP